MNFEVSVKDLITKQEAASILKISDSGVSLLSKRGELDEVRFSKKRILFDRSDVLQLAKRRGINPVEKAEV